MSYMPVDYANSALVEEEVLRVHLNDSGASSDISVHRYISSHNSLADGYNNPMPSEHRRGQSTSPSSSFRRRRPLPPLNPLTLSALSISNSNIATDFNPPNGNPSASNTSIGPQDSPFLRKLESIRRSSAEFSITNFRQNYTNSNTNSNSSINFNSAGPSGTDFDDVGADQSLDPLAVKPSTSSESQCLYGNESVVRELKPEYARWFYKYEQDRTWTPFTGYDSIRMELRYRNLTLERETYSAEGQTNLTNHQEGYYPSESSGYYIDNQYHYHENPYHNHSQHEALSMNCYNEHQHQPDYNPYFPPNSHLPPTFTSPPRFDSGSVNVNDEYSVNGAATCGVGNLESKDVGDQQAQSDENCGENVIIVRGGLYEADLESWTCVATYWPGDKCQITRGTWFYDGTWQPLSVEHAEKLEEEHMGQFSGVSLAIYTGNGNGSSQPESPTKKNRPVVHRVSFCEFHVDWTSPTEIHLFSKAASYKFMRSVGQRLGFQTWGHRLCRGYFKPASIVDRPSEISHLVFVVHGIGQKMDTGRIVRNCASFRETVSSLKEKFFPHLNETKQRAEFFPVEWRSAAKLDGDVVDAITPHKLLSLRQLLNATAMDIMYYTSPLYRTEIQNALRNELNRIYSNFVKRNPEFPSRGGKVSVIAHSLGAVITYDIITGYMPQAFGPEIPQNTMPSYNHSPEGAFSSNGNTDSNYQLQEHFPPGLLFQLEHFFCLGSPLSVFLALRWREPHNPSFRSFILPKLLCKRIYNVFYSTDPVAYRLEPLFNKNYVHIAPLPVYAYGSLGRPKYDEMPRERINKEINFSRQPEPPNQTTNGFAQPDSAKSTPQRTMNLKSPPTPTKESNWGWQTLLKYLQRSDNGPGGGGISDGDIGSELVSPDGNSSPSRDDDSSTPEDLAKEISNDLEYRMDYVLKESNFSSTYLAALTSHTSYWSSPDTAFFVLSHLYGDALDIPPQPPPLAQ